MTHEQTSVLLEAARASRQGVGAFNVITLEHAEAVVLGAERARASVILQLSENAIAFHDENLFPIVAACGELARTARVPVAVHLDHVKDRELFEGIEHTSVSSVMFDASELPYEDNVSRPPTSSGGPTATTCTSRQNLARWGEGRGPRARRSDRPRRGGQVRRPH